MSESKTANTESDLTQSVNTIGALAWPKITAKHVARDLQSSVSTARRVRHRDPVGLEARERLADQMQGILERRLAALVELERAIGALRKRRR